MQNGGIPSSEILSVKGWGSWNVGLNWMAAQQKSLKAFYWDFGIGFQFNNFKFEKPWFPGCQEVTIKWVCAKEWCRGISRSKNFLLPKRHAMTMLELDFGKWMTMERMGPSDSNSPYAGYRLGGPIQYVYRELDGSGRKKDKQNTGWLPTKLPLRTTWMKSRRAAWLFFSTYDIESIIPRRKRSQITTSDHLWIVFLKTMARLKLHPFWKLKPTYHESIIILTSHTLFRSLGSLTAQNLTVPIVEEKRRSIPLWQYWYYEKYEDGTSSLEMEAKDYTTTNNSSHQASKFSSDKWK